MPFYFIAFLLSVLTSNIKVGFDVERRMARRFSRVLVNDYIIDRSIGSIMLNVFSTFDQVVRLNEINKLIGLDAIHKSELDFLFYMSGSGVIFDWIFDPNQ